VLGSGRCLPSTLKPGQSGPGCEGKNMFMHTHAPYVGGAVWDSGQSLLPTKTSQFAYMLVEGSLSCINGGEIVLDSGTPRKPEVGSDKVLGSTGGCIARSTIAGRPDASGAGHAPACSGVHT
jgi:hypothetical protein